MNPGSFRKARKVERNNRAVQLYHILFQFGKIALTVTPTQVSLSVIINKDGGIYIIPVAFAAVGRHIISDEGGTAGIDKRACRRIGYGYTDRLTRNGFMLYRHIPIKFTVALYYLTCPSFTLCPRKVFRF